MHEIEILYTNCTRLDVLCYQHGCFLAIYCKTICLPLLKDILILSVYYCFNSKRFDQSKYHHDLFCSVRDSNISYISFTDSINYRVKPIFESVMAVLFDIDVKRSHFNLILDCCYRLHFLLFHC